MWVRILCNYEPRRQYVGCPSSGWRYDLEDPREDMCAVVDGVTFKFIQGVINHTCTIVSLYNKIDF